MYFKIPARDWKKDNTIINKPIVHNNLPIGIITHYDEVYIYGVLWTRLNPEFTANYLSGKDELNGLHIDFGLKEKKYGYHYSNG